MISFDHQSNQKFYAFPSDNILRLLDSDRSWGLSHEQVKLRIEKFGLNQLEPEQSRTFLERLWGHINSIFIYLLLIGSILSFIFHHYPDGVVIICVVVINIVFGFYMEGKAEKTTDTLKNMMNTSAVVLREGEKITIDAELLTLGDIIFLEAGNIVPADCRILDSFDLGIMEAALTGESHAILKEPEVIESENLPLADRLNMVFSGTQVLKGTAKCIVVEIGDHCELGKINKMLKNVEVTKTPLVIQLEIFEKYLAASIISVAAIAFGVAIARGYSAGDALSFSIGIAVAAIPEGLPSCVTIIFSIGIYFMAKRNAIIKSLPSVETLGNVSVICSDKTGTLTMNKMKVKAIALFDQIIELSDNGLMINSNEIYSNDTIVSMIYPGLFCNAGSILLQNNNVNNNPLDIESGSGSSKESFTIEGDPTETCILTLGAQQVTAIELKSLKAKYPCLGEVPFDSATKFMATLHKISKEELLNRFGEDISNIKDLNDGDFNIVFLKGAPEKVCGFCLEDSIPILENATNLASRGMRVLGLAYQIIPSNLEIVHVFEDESPYKAKFKFSCLLGIIDPPRPEAIEAIAQAQQAGITVKMITGDHPLTAAAIGKTLGLHINPQGAITGTILDQLLTNDPATFDEIVITNDIFARTTPEHKLRIVESLQRQGKVCSMTGDGVNDAPALKASNLGVSMGIIGTEVAKDASKMILTDDNFATIVHAIRVGRCTYDNLIKVLAFVLPTNGGQAFSIIMALVIDVQVPITALQILWVNMVTSVTLGLVLAFEKADKSVMDLPPRRPNKAIFGRFLTWRILFITTLLVIATLTNYEWEKIRFSSVHKLRTVAVNTFTTCQVGYLFNCRNLRNNPSSWKGYLLGNPVIYIGIFIIGILQVIFTYAPPFQYVFQTESLDGQAWGQIILWAVIIFMIVEIEKWIGERKQKYFHSKYQLSNAKDSSLELSNSL